MVSAKLGIFVPERHAARARSRVTMSRMSFVLSKAVATGRDPAVRVRTREAVLAALLSKRAAAHRAGLHGQERLLRDQILWSLPVRRDDASAAARTGLAKAGAEEG